MALQAQLHIHLPPSSSNPSGTGSGRASLSYPLSSGPHAYDRGSLNHFNPRASHSHSNDHDYSSLTSSSNHNSSWSASTLQQSQESLYHATSSTTLPPSSGASLATTLPTSTSDTGSNLSSDVGPSGSFGLSMATPSGMMNSRSTAYPSTTGSHSMHATTASMTTVTAPSSDTLHQAYAIRSNQSQPHDQSQSYDDGSYGNMDFTTTPPADSGASQAPSAMKSTTMPNPFSSSSLLNPATDHFSDQVTVNGPGQSHSSALPPGYAAGTSSSSSTRTSIASTSSTANTPLTPITPLTPVSTSAFYSNNISASTSDVSNLRVSSSLPTLSHEVDMHENYMNFHPDMKARMHSVSLPTPPIAVNGAGSHGLPLHCSVSMNGMGHSISAMTCGPTSAPLPPRHFSLPSLPHTDYRTSQSYSTSPGSLAAPINHIGSNDSTKHAAMLRGHAGPARHAQSGLPSGLSLGSNGHGLDQSLHQDSADMPSLEQRALPPGASSHSQLPFVMPPYNTGRPVMSHGVNLGMNVNMGLGLNGSGGFSPGTSTTTAAAAAAAAMAMGTGHPGSAAAARAATAATTTSGTSKKHKCKICDKRFTRPSSLQTHMYSHTGEKPFTCDYENCGRQFSVVSNLRRHKKVHKGVAPSGVSSNANGSTSPCVSR